MDAGQEADSGSAVTSSGLSCFSGADHSSLHSENPGNGGGGASSQLRALSTTHLTSCLTSALPSSLVFCCSSYVTPPPVCSQHSKPIVSFFDLQGPAPADPQASPASTPSPTSLALLLQPLWSPFSPSGVFFTCCSLYLECSSLTSILCQIDSD